MTSQFEQMPDEILLMICQYLPQYRIIVAFFNLNYRLNCTISQYLQSLLVKCDFVRQLIPMVGTHIQSLVLKQTELLPSEFELMPNLQEITFYHSRLGLIPRLDYLTDINVIAGPNFQAIDVLFANPGILHSVFIASSTPLIIPREAPSKTSSIKQLTVTLRTLDDLQNLFALCPELTCLNLLLNDFSATRPAESDIAPQLRTFSLRTRYDVQTRMNQLRTIARYLPEQLEHLAFDLSTNDASLIDGSMWETYLTECYPNLNRLDFVLVLHPNDESNNQKLPKVSTILTTFQTRFLQSLFPLNITGYVTFASYTRVLCIHTESIPTVYRRRYFLN